MMNLSSFKYRPLAPGEAHQRIDAARQGERRAINRLVDGSVRLAVLLVNQHPPCSIDRQELFSLALIGVLDAIAHWVPSRGAWSTAVALRIRSRWSRAITDNSRLCRGHGAVIVSLDDVGDILPAPDTTSRQQELSEALRLLSAADAELVMLRLSGFNQSEVATMQGYSTATVRRRERKLAHSLHK
jgi:RNA polymerase sigma factor (sigma-70 family)